MRIQFSEPKVDMTASGVVGSQPFSLESDSSFLRSKIKVAGCLGTQSFVLEGKTKNLVNRNFKVAGSWAAIYALLARV